MKANTSGKQRNIKVHKEWKFHRRVNTNNPVEHIVSHHSGNVFYLAAVGLDHGVTEVQLKQRSGRIHLTGVKFSDEDDGFSDSGFIHKDNIVGGGGVVPQGGIIMWSRSAANIPAGWALCNGSNGTPDLRGRFVVGYSGSGSYTAVGNTGGSDSRTLTTANMPSHSHTGNTGVTSISHSHSFNTNNDGAHKHRNLDVGYTPVGNDDTTLLYQDDGTPWGNHNYDMSDGSSHSHSGTTNSANSQHSHSFTTGTSGSGIAFDNRPAYYVVAFIIKL